MEVRPVEGIEEIRESIKTLRTNIEFAGMDKKITSVLLTSSVPSEGKSTIATNLAISMADMGKSTLLVENDFRKPRLANALGIRVERGLLDILNDTCKLDDVILETEHPDLYFLGIGGVIGNPVEVLASNRYGKIVEELKTMFEFVVFDAPPIGTIIDGALISPHVDGVIVVIRSGVVNPLQVKKVMAQLEKSGARILGAVLNDVDYTREGYGYYAYKYEEKTQKKGLLPSFGK